MRHIARDFLTVGNKIEVLESNTKAKKGSIGRIIRNVNFNQLTIAVVIFTRFGMSGKNRLTAYSLFTETLDMKDIDLSDEENSIIQEVINNRRALLGVDAQSISRIKKVKESSKNLLKLPCLDFVSYITALSLLIRDGYNATVNEAQYIPLNRGSELDTCGLIKKILEKDDILNILDSYLRSVGPESIGAVLVRILEYGTDYSNIILKYFDIPDIRIYWLNVLRKKVSTTRILAIDSKLMRHNYNEQLEMFRLKLIDNYDNGKSIWRKLCYRGVKKL